MDTKGSAALAPTLWRTCRALANRRRLQLLRCLIKQKAPVRVTDAAELLGASLSATSQCLRALNARGLLRAQRKGRDVVYQVGHDPALPQSRVLLDALQSELGRSRRSLENAFDALTGFTHPRRIALVQAVARGLVRPHEIRTATRVSTRAAARHLDKLVRRGYLARRGHTYRIARPASRLARSLLVLALSDR